MARYRKIDPRVWSDERFLACNPIQRLAWFYLLTHPSMTPMGAGVVQPGSLDDMINGTDQCWLCNDICKEPGNHSAEAMITYFAREEMILVDGRLVIVKNYLLYNRPENPNHLAGWIESCEELPRSVAFARLREHLRTQLPPLPNWLYAGLLDPLEQQKNRGLKALFWERVKGYPIPSGDGMGEPSPHPPPNQEQEQEQEQEKYKSARAPRFVPPTIEEVRAYIAERNSSVDAEQWMDHYTSNGWKVGRNPMKDWKAAVRQWERSRFDAKKQSQPHSQEEELKRLRERLGDRE